MNDYAKLYHAQRQAEADERAIAELERRAAPLHWMVLAATLAICVSLAWDGWQRHAELEAANELLVQCLNGRMVGIGEAVLRCEVYDLVAGVPDAQ